MPDQLTLYAPAVARARHSDPLPSHEAAARVEASGKAERDRQAIVATLEREQRAMTFAEIAEAAGMDYHDVARRMNECVIKGKVRAEGRKDCPIRGAVVTAWRAR